MKVTVISIVIFAHRTISKELVKGLEDLKIREQEKSPGDLWRFVVTQTPVRNHQEVLV